MRVLTLAPLYLCYPLLLFASPAFSEISKRGATIDESCTTPARNTRRSNSFRDTTRITRYAVHSLHWYSDNWDRKGIDQDRRRTLEGGLAAMFGQRVILGSSHDEDSVKDRLDDMAEKFDKVFTYTVSDIHITCNPNWANETHDGKTYDEDHQKKNKRASKFWRWDTIHERWRQFAVADLCADQLGFTDHHRRLSPPDVLTLCPDLWDKTDAAKELRNWRDEVARWAVCQRAGVHLNKFIESVTFTFLHEMFHTTWVGELEDRKVQGKLAYEYADVKRLLATAAIQTFSNVNNYVYLAVGLWFADAGWTVNWDSGWMTPPTGCDDGRASLRQIPRECLTRDAKKASEHPSEACFCEIK